MGPYICHPRPPSPLVFHQNSSLWFFLSQEGQHHVPLVAALSQGLAVRPLAPTSLCPRTKSFVKGMRGFLGSIRSCGEVDASVRPQLWGKPYPASTGKPSNIFICIQYVLDHSQEKEI